MPLNVGDISPVSVPPAIGGAVLAAEPLRHGQANAATGGIWRVRGPDGPRSSRSPAPPADDLAEGLPTSDEPTHWNYWRRETFSYEPARTAPLRRRRDPAPGLLVTLIADWADRS